LFASACLLIVSGTVPVGQSEDQKPVSIALPHPFVFKEGWTDVVIEYLLACTLASACLISLWGELTIGGIGLFGGPSHAVNECALTAPILYVTACLVRGVALKRFFLVFFRFGAASTVSFAYSCLLVLLSVVGLRKAIDTAVLSYCP
jgi:hypothetical protein